MRVAGLGGLVGLVVGEELQVSIAEPQWMAAVQRASRCKVEVDGRKHGLEEPHCVGQFEGVTRGRLHLLTQVAETEITLKAICGMQESRVVEIEMAGKTLPWVILQPRSRPFAISLYFKKVKAEETRKMWKDFFGTLTALLFAVEGILILRSRSISPCCVGKLRMHRRLVRRLAEAGDTFEIIRTRGLGGGVQGKTEEQSRKLTAAEIADLQTRLVQLMEAQLPADRLTGSGADRATMTPSQRFYENNKDLLVRRVAEIFSADEDDEWKKFPVVRPPAGHLWTFGDDPAEYLDPEFAHGEFPGVEKLMIFLANEQVFNLATVDLAEVGRRDLGERCIVGSVQTSRHAGRVADLLVDKINSLAIPHVRASCPISDRQTPQDWLVVHFGGFVIHLMTSEVRTRFNVEGVLQQPDLWLNATAAEDFPHYNEHWSTLRPASD